MDRLYTIQVDSRITGDGRLYARGDGATVDEQGNLTVIRFDGTLPGGRSPVLMVPSGKWLSVFELPASQSEPQLVSHDYKKLFPQEIAAAKE
jgi:hypothetical protein